MTTPPPPPSAPPSGPDLGDPYAQSPQAQSPYEQAPNEQIPYDRRPPYEFVDAAEMYTPRPRYAPLGSTTCRFCGGFPAVEATVRAHRGMILMMQWRSLKGPFCRTCGIATVRRLSGDTLWQGWWGYISFAVTPVMLLINLFTFLKIRKLSEPVPGMPGKPMDTGEPLLMRWSAVGFLIPVVLIYLLAVG